MNLLRLFFWIFKNGPHEIDLPNGALERIWPQLRTRLNFDKSQIRYAFVTFDYEMTSDGIHEWLTRRWNSYTVSINSCAALGLSHMVAQVLSIHQIGVGV